MLPYGPSPCFSGTFLVKENFSMSPKGKVVLAFIIWMLGIVFMVIGILIGEIEHTSIQTDFFRIGMLVTIAGLFLIMFFRSKLPRR